MLNEETVEAARSLVLSTYTAGKELSDEMKGTEVNPLIAGMLAYASLMLACCRQCGVHPLHAMQAAEMMLGSGVPPNTTVH
jgi:hypothetical protein